MLAGMEFFCNPKLGRRDEVAALVEAAGGQVAAEPSAAGVVHVEDEERVMRGRVRRRTTPARICEALVAVLQGQLPVTDAQGMVELAAVRPDVTETSEDETQVPDADEADAEYDATTSVPAAEEPMPATNAKLMQVDPQAAVALAASEAEQEAEAAEPVPHRRAPGAAAPTGATEVEFMELFVAERYARIALRTCRGQSALSADPEGAVGDSQNTDLTIDVPTRAPRVGGGCSGSTSQGSGSGVDGSGRGPNFKRFKKAHPVTPKLVAFDEDFSFEPQHAAEFRRRAKAADRTEARNEHTFTTEHVTKVARAPAKPRAAPRKRKV